MNEMQKKINELEKRIEDTKPSLSGIMSGIQRHHAKLYYAGVRKNWKLAQYELGEIKGGINRSAASYKEAENGASMMKESIEALDAAVAQQNDERFVQSFTKLTESCNSCHQAHEHGFISIEIPGPGMFTDQKFRQ
jgi:cytochrome c556